jgi:hypothetical protein
MGRVLTSEDLRNWFSKSHPEGGWKRINSKGEAIGPCAREPGEPKPKCMSNEKRAMLSKRERASAVRTKRRHDPNPERKGEPIMISNFGKGKISEGSEESRRELDAYRALEMARDRSIPTGTIFKATGGYRQSVVDARNTTTEKKTKKSTKKKPINEEYDLDPTDRIFESLDVLLEKNAPTNPELWSQAKAAAKAKFDVYPSAYANGWAAKWYKSKGGKWKSVDESLNAFSSFVDKKAILSEMNTFGEVIGRTAAVVVEKHIVQDNLKPGVGADQLRSFAKKFGAKTKSQKETTEFMFDDENAADSFMKAITGKSLAEANECEGRKAGKPWRTPGEKKKFAVCVDNKIVRFGDPGLSIKRDQPGRLKNFRARHGCDKGGISRDTPKYWSCQMWRKDKSVSDLTQGD